MLYTKKGDGGTTKTFGCDQRISKSSSIAEALGSLDEINSFLGLCKINSRKEKLKTAGGLFFSDIVNTIQENLFIVQAEMAGAPKKIEKEKVVEVETIVDNIEKELPLIKTFFISGSTECGALFDIARTISRRAERRAVTVVEDGKVKLSPDTLAYLNRLSSLLYALARLSSHKSGINEFAPSYK